MDVEALTYSERVAWIVDTSPIPPHVVYPPIIHAGEPTDRGVLPGGGSEKEARGKPPPRDFLACLRLDQW